MGGFVSHHRYLLPVRYQEDRRTILFEHPDHIDDILCRKHVYPGIGFVENGELRSESEDRREFYPLPLPAAERSVDHPVEVEFGLQSHEFKKEGGVGFFLPDGKIIRNTDPFESHRLLPCHRDAEPGPLMDLEVVDSLPFKEYIT